MLDSQSKLDIIRQSMAGQLNVPAYEAINKEEAQTEEAVQGQEETQQQVPTAPEPAPVAPPAAQTIPQTESPKQEFVSPNNQLVGLNQTSGSKNSSRIQPGQHRNGGILRRLEKGGKKTKVDTDPKKKEWKEGDDPIDFGMLDEITLTDKNPNIVKFDRPKAMGGTAPMPSGSLRSIISVAKNLPKTIKKGKEFLSAIKKTFKYKYGKTLKTSDIPKDVWTHATKSKEALKTWDKGKKIVGRGEDLSKFTRQIDQGTFTLSKSNQNSPNFKKGSLFSGSVPKDKSFLITRKGSQGFIPNLNKVNLSSFKGTRGSAGVGVLKPGSRSTKNLKYWQYDEPAGLFNTVDPSKLKYGGQVPKYNHGGKKHDPPKKKLTTYDDLNGDSKSFTGDQRKDEYINKQINTGKWGYDETTGGLSRLESNIDVPISAEEVRKNKLDKFLNDGHAAVVNNPVFKAVAGFTPPGALILGAQSAIKTPNLINEFTEAPSLATGANLALNTLAMVPASKVLNVPFSPVKDAQAIKSAFNSFTTKAKASYTAAKNSKLPKVHDGFNSNLQIGHKNTTNSLLKTKPSFSQSSEKIKDTVYKDILKTSDHNIKYPDGYGSTTASGELRYTTENLINPTMRGQLELQAMNNAKDRVNAINTYNEGATARAKKEVSDFMSTPKGKKMQKDMDTSKGKSISLTDFHKQITAGGEAKSVAHIQEYYQKNYQFINHLVADGQLTVASGTSKGNISIDLINKYKNDSKIVDEFQRTVPRSIRGAMAHREGVGSPINETDDMHEIMYGKFKDGVVGQTQAESMGAESSNRFGEGLYTGNSDQLGNRFAGSEGLISQMSTLQGADLAALSKLTPAQRVDALEAMGKHVNMIDPATGKTYQDLNEGVTAFGLEGGNKGVRYIYSEYGDDTFTGMNKASERVIVDPSKTTKEGIREVDKGVGKLDKGMQGRMGALGATRRDDSYSLINGLYKKLPKKEGKYGEFSPEAEAYRIRRDEFNATNVGIEADRSEARREFVEREMITLSDVYRKRFKDVGTEGHGELKGLTEHNQGSAHTSAEKFTLPFLPASNFADKGVSTGSVLERAVAEELHKSHMTAYIRNHDANKNRVEYVGKQGEVISTKIPWVDSSSITNGDKIKFLNPGPKLGLNRSVVRDGVEAYDPGRNLNILAKIAKHYKDPTKGDGTILTRTTPLKMDARNQIHSLINKNSDLLGRSSIMGPVSDFNSKADVSAIRETLEELESKGQKIEFDKNKYETTPRSDGRGVSVAKSWHGDEPWRDAFDRTFIDKKKVIKKFGGKLKKKKSKK